MPDENEKHEFSWPKFIRYCRDNGIGEWSKLEPKHWEDVECWWDCWKYGIMADRKVI
jgi:hypothetical protein